MGELQTSLTTKAEDVIDNDVNGGLGLRFELKNSAYDVEDLIHNLMIITANLIDFGDQRSQRYNLDIDLDLDGVAS